MPIECPQRCAPFLVLISLICLASGCLLVDTALSDTFGSNSEVRRDSRNNAVTLVKSENLSYILQEEEDYRSLMSMGAYGEMALTFIARHHEEFFVFDPLSELSITQVHVDDLGFHQVRLTQRYQNLEILDNVLIVSFNREDNIYLVQGSYLPTPSYLSIIPRLSEADAKQLLSATLEQNTNINVGRLVIFPTEEGTARLAYQFETRRGVLGGQQIITDANSGDVLRNTPTSYQ